jgi:zinc protease
MKQKLSLVRFLACPALLILAASAAGTELGKDIDIPYTKFVLKNGLTLVVHEDHKAPIVAVNVWYHVGSKNEKPGKTGFAHLFEHLMFNGSEHFNDDYFKAVEKVGATDLNGTTDEDRTNYFQNAPKDALDLLLWLESDRMGHLLGAVTQAKLDEQRGVVQNEKRQGENQPYGKAQELMTKGMFPPGHPYSWTVIGSMEDLNAASLSDAHEWFKTYYGPANATLVVAGDVETEAVRKKVETYFGDIPPGPPLTRHSTWIAKRSGTHREMSQDRVPQARLYKAWNIPEWGTAQGDYLNLVSDVLAQGKNSRLYKRLVYDDQIASDVSASVQLGEIAGGFLIIATARPGQDLSQVEKAIDEELAKLLAEGPTKKELERIKTQNLAQFIRQVERIGGFGGKSDVLAESQVYAGSPDHYKTTLKRMREATVQDLQDAARAWLSDGVYILEIHPFPELATTASAVDRSKMPEPVIHPEVKFPELQRTNLANGLKIIVAERHAVPVVNCILLLDAGYAADQLGRPGTARLAMDMLDEGTRTRSALEISDALAQLGANLHAGSSLDSSTVNLSALKANLDPSLDIFAEVILNPAFPEKELARLKKEQLDDIKQEKASPFQMALRVFPRLVYGPDHAYGNPFTGSGTEQSVTQITQADIQTFHATWFKPNNATLVVVGDTTLAEITPKLHKLFRAWTAGELPQKNIRPVAQKSKPSIYLLDRPGSIQSVIFAGHVAPPKSYAEEIALETMNYVLGGAFTSRINMNLREDKHWTYGAHCVIPDARGQRPLVVFAPVQTDKTREAITEIHRELQGICGSQPVTPDELAKAKDAQTLKLPGAWETAARVAGSILEILQYGLPDDHFTTYPNKVRALRPDDMQKTAQDVLHPDKLIWVVVGDRTKIEASLRELGYGDILLLDADGNPTP